MRINSINNTRNQSFKQLKIAPDAGKLIRQTASISSNSRWAELLGDIEKAKSRLQNTKWGDIIVDIKDNDYVKPARLVFLTHLRRPIFNGSVITTKEIQGNCVYSDTQINGRVSKGTGISVTPYDSLQEAINVIERNEADGVCEYNKLAEPYPICAENEKQVENRSKIQTSLKNLGI
ncbi:MAG: hypothetical protein MJ231_08665 [bacterium]|nr:hypothetical protein [bacterium]